MATRMMATQDVPADVPDVPVSRPSHWAPRSSWLTTSGPADLTRSPAVRLVGGLPVAVWGQERGQRCQRLLGGLLGEPVAGTGNDCALHIVC
jgi:hypothetical protein